MDTPGTVGLFLLTASAIATAGTALYKYRNNQISNKKCVVFVIYALIMGLYGFALLGHKPFLQYSPLHLISVVFFVYSGFLLLYAKKHSRLIMWGFFAFYIGLNLYKIPYMWIYNHSFYAILPLHICSLSSVFMIARPFYSKSKSPMARQMASLFDNYLICFTFLGALLNVFLAPPHGFGPHLSFFSYWTFESNLLHWSFFTVSIYYLLSGEIKPNKKMAVMNLFWIMPAYVVYIILNSIFGHNFFYTNSDDNPILFLYNFFPMWEWALGGTRIEVNPLYWAAILGTAALALYIITMLYERIVNRWGPARPE